MINATLMVDDSGNNCQQYENEINKSTAEQGERNEDGGGEREERRNRRRQRDSTHGEEKRQTKPRDERCEFRRKQKN